MVKSTQPLVSTSDSRRQTLSQIKQEIHRELINAIDSAQVNTMEDDRLRKELRRGIESLYRRRNDLLTESERNRITNEIIDDTLGLGPLESLLRDPTISDILVNGPDTIFVERRGQLERVSTSFKDADHLVQIVQRIAGKVGRRLDESSPMVDARMSDGSRVNAVIGPLALDGALVSIRRFGDRRLQASDLIAHRAMTGEMWDFLSTCVAAGLNVIVSGGTGSGKSTLMNALCTSIPANQRIVTIEDAAELDIQQPHVARMETRCANLQGTGEVTARDLVRNALRMRPDRIIIGECRGSEAFDMLQAMTTGHDGSLTTLHANGPRSALRRLEMLVGMAGMELPLWFIRELVGSAVQIVVQCVRLTNGQRKITAISEVTGVVGDTVSLHDIFKFGRQDIDPTTGKPGCFMTTGIRPVCLSRLKDDGVNIDPGFFEERILRVERCDTIPRMAEAQRRTS